MSSILVTGVAGFIGSNFVNTFKKQFPAYQLIGIDDFSTGRRDALDPDILFYEGSICDDALVQRIFTKHHPDYVFHFAAEPRVKKCLEEPLRSHTINVLGTLQLLACAKQFGAKRFIFSSSAAVYGNPEVQVLTEDLKPVPASPYGLQKAQGEQNCQLYSRLYGLETICLRYFNAFGPGQHGNSAYATVISAWLEGIFFPNPNKPPYIEGDGTQSRDFCFVDNIVQANLLAMQHQNPLHGEVCNIASGEVINLIQLKTLLEQYLHKPIVLQQRPARIGDIKHSQADISYAKQLLGYTPIPFAHGLKKTIDWFQKRISL